MNKIPEKTPLKRRGDIKRKLLIDVGTALFTQKGFFNTGLDEIVQTAGVPKGSFYYYFGTKEEYVFEVIKNYETYFAKKLDRALNEESLTPLKRLKSFTEEATNAVQRFEFKRGCLVGNLGQEMASLEDGVRVRLLELLNEWQHRFSSCIDDAKAAGEISTSVDSQQLAQFFWSAWEGAVLCAKLERSTKPLENISMLFFDHMLLPVRPTLSERART
ncbi:MULTISPECIES: TetR/AcrR family transcriptional regulator [unclassified Polaromonas]|uniref:TetR/AcrR family transcriptional regulator n=1 Tax=unclassified Polaromonas TaxID=2638319 RepID=UPI001A1C1877|nr:MULTISPECIES: TetR/AcrR family transcriptional regulator [unclassified Polaromonas]MBG6073754.1 TetR/AcrR family transcriptional repressor of nem operon [Polaromonas sp. CG_9.7]MBG6115802.1 TetR/AcrR family transcriptional repressor of nem operon [Polaromonas sp. CG_9.2]MDH6186704.1 TetR/AcrR family transcriptional repressor of nem operon [Polaromonas sp. CG_23.6]